MQGAGDKPAALGQEQRSSCFNGDGGGACGLQKASGEELPDGQRPSGGAARHQGLENDQQVDRKVPDDEKKERRREKVDPCTLGGKVVGEHPAHQGGKTENDGQREACAAKRRCPERIGGILVQAGGHKPGSQGEKVSCAYPLAREPFGVARGRIPVSGTPASVASRPFLEHFGKKDVAGIAFGEVNEFWGGVGHGRNCSGKGQCGPRRNAPKKGPLLQSSCHVSRIGGRGERSGRHGVEKRLDGGGDVGRTADGGDDGDAVDA